MASLPPSQASRRRPSEQSIETAPEATSPALSSSNDTNPVLLNPLSTPSSSAQHAPTPTNPPAEVRTCWICQQDDTEDESPDMVWRTPCPCSLTAHDSCLLEWIANEEAPKKGEIAHNHRIKCPQCQAEIQIERPRDYLVGAVDSVHRLAKTLILPSALSAFAGCFYSGLLVYGLNTMHIVFGPHEARQILGVVNPDEGMDFGRRWSRLVRDTARWSMTAFDPFFPEVGPSSNLKIFLGLPLIGPSLVILRTRFADQAFALLLPLYFLDPSHRGDLLDWPPTPGLTFATMPYIRTAYNELYRHTVGPYEKRWEAAVQRKPREGETAEEIAQQARADEEEGQAIFEVEIVHEELRNAGDRIQPAPGGGRVLGGGGNPDIAAQDVDHPEAADIAAAADVINAVHQAQGQGQPPRNDADANAGWEIRQDIPATHIVSTAMGALFFPTVASFMGELLRVSLPARWVDKHAGMRIASRNGGLLKEKWGRTLVGGCLFVVLKDVVTLYCKWKKARDFGKRRVLDYVGTRRTRS